MTAPLKIAIIVGPDTGNEYQAIRQTLEYFGALVMVFFVGRPNDFIEFLQGATPFQGFDHFILSFHGDDGHFCLPELDETIYLPHEPKENLCAAKIADLANIQAQVVVCTGCTLGNAKMAESFIDGGALAYIGTPNYIEANAMLLFLQRFYYELLSHKRSLAEAYQLAAEMDEGTKMVLLYPH